MTKGWTGWVVMAGLALAALSMTYLTAPEVRRASFWGDGWQEKPLGDRVSVLPADALPSLRDGLSDHHFISQVVPARNAKYVIQDVQRAIDDMPQEVRDLVRDRLVGIYLVEGLAQSENSDSLGMAFEVQGFWRQHVGTVILIDRNDTDKRANEAMAGMEYVPSRDYRGMAVAPRLARRGENDRVTTLRYVLLHEFGHLVDFERDIVSGWFSHDDAHPDCAFACLSWINPDRHRYSRYLNSAMSQVQSGNHDDYVRSLPDTFQRLEKSNFPSLYATTMPAEDFAESFAMYVHTVLMQRPWELTLRKNGTIVGTLGSCFTDGRCRDKRDYFDRLFAEVRR